mmetsp:Transcript_34158/g.30910  ORF Transcript_34158/g.30910 Transcript_34158/m.30910 type:complete len:187 (-) Transcript_34158:435-995(-)
MDSFIADGILGLGYTSENSKTSSILDVLKDQGLIQSKSFSLYLNYEMAGTQEFGGELIFGGYNDSYLGNHSKFHYVRVEDDKFWATSIDYILVDGISVGNLSHYKAVFDSGTNTITLPEANFDRFFENMEELGYDCEVDGDMIECNCGAGIEFFPVLNLALDKESFGLPPEYYVVDVGDDKCIPMI